MRQHKRTADIRLVPSLLLLLSLTGALPGCREVPLPAAPAPNIVFIIIDDLRPALGFWGDKIAQTPNIDALARSGVTFTRAFASVPVCGASRASILSGRKPTTQRFLTFNSRLDQDLPDAPSLPQVLLRQGYYTVANGKVFDVSRDTAQSWSEPLWNPDGEWASSVQRKDRHEDLQKAYLMKPTGTLGPAIERLDVADDAYPDGRVTLKSIADLKRLGSSEQPFFLAIGLRKPHLPFTAPSRYWASYAEQDFELPSTYALPAELWPDAALHNSQELRRQYSGIPAEGLLEPDLARELMHGYYAAVSYVDAQVGKIVQAVDAVDPEAVVVLVGDHGWNLGEHRLWTKHSLFDVTLQVPVILRHSTLGTSEVDAVVSLLDLFPTLVELASVQPPAVMDGRSLLPLIEKSSDDGPNDNRSNDAESRLAFSRWFDGESVRTGRYRYTHWRSEAGVVSQRMLFDLLTDPHESQNLAEQSDYENVVERLSMSLAEHYPAQPWAPLLHRVVEARAAGQL